MYKNPIEIIQGEENALIKFGIWQITVNGFCCSCCGYKLQASGFSAICPYCHAHMLTVKTKEKEKITNDLISRQAAIAVADYSDYVGLFVDDVKKVTDEVVKGLRQLPPVQLADVAPVMHGEWVRTEVGSEKPWKCSECGYQPVHYSAQVKPYEHYCGNCGAKMR